MKTRKIFQWAGLACLAVFMMTSCSNDDPAPPVPAGSKGDLAVLSMITNPEGTTGTSWLQLIDGISPKTVDNSNAYQVGFGTPPLPVFGNDLFTTPDYGQSNTFQKWTRQPDGTLVKGASLELPLNSFATHGAIYSREKGYLPTRNGKLLIFNPSTMMLSGEIDLTSYSLAAGYVPFTGTPFIDGDLMYLPLSLTNESGIPLTEAMIDMLIIDVKTDKVLKRIQENKSGLTHAGYPSGEQKNAFKDEKGDIYFIAAGAFSRNPKYKSGILRIKNGTQEIDPTYNWVFNDQAIEGESGKPSWLAVAHYMGNGKLYGMADIPDYWADPSMPNWSRDRSLISVEIDIYNKTVKKLPIPNTCAYSAHISPYDNLLLFSVWGEKDSGFYTYDPQTGKASSEAVIKMQGFAHWCYQFK